MKIEDMKIRCIPDLYFCFFMIEPMRLLFDTSFCSKYDIRLLDSDYFLNHKLQLVDIFEELFKPEIIDTDEVVNIARYLIKCFRNVFLQFPYRS